MSPENLSTKAVDNPVKKGAGSKMSCASLHIDQKMTSLNTFIKNNSLYSKNNFVNLKILYDIFLLFVRLMANQEIMFFLTEIVRSSPKCHEGVLYG